MSKSITSHGYDNRINAHVFTYSDGTSETADAKSEREAREAATALDEALSHGASAEAFKLAGEWYVVTRDTGEGYDFAYEISYIDIDDVSREDWDYSLWCSEVVPSEDTDVAKAYYVATNGRLLGTAGSCTPVLSDDELQMLEEQAE